MTHVASDAQRGRVTTGHEKLACACPISRRDFLGHVSAGAAALTMVAPAAAGRSPAVSVTDFGAKGDGITNDTAAFNSATAAIEAQGGGTLLIPYGTYIVGQQGGAPGSHVAGQVYPASPIIRIRNCLGSVIVQGISSAIGTKPIIRAAAGLHFGSFDPVTGEAYYPASLPFTDNDYRADAYNGMIELSGNHFVIVSNLELDGNQENLVLGGIWGDQRRHGLDGVLIANAGLQTTDNRPHILSRVYSNYNARNNLSWVGGSGLTATDCTFNGAGKGAFESAPGAGVDIEPESTRMAGGNFINCMFVNNFGAGIPPKSGSGLDDPAQHPEIGECRYGLVMISEPAEICGSAKSRFHVRYRNPGDPKRLRQPLTN